MSAAVGSLSAVVDLGTITARLLILGENGLRVTDRRFTRLGEGIADTGALSAASLERTAEALANFKTAIDEAGVTRVNCIATSAARDASNPEDLAALVRQHLGTELEVISGEDEGRYAFLGATSSHGTAGNYAVTLDIGGGSTEFVVGPVGVPDGAVESFSADIGASRATQAYIVTDPPAPEDLSAALSVVELHVIDARRAIPNLVEVASNGPVIGIGGTITTVAAVDLGLIVYDADKVNGHVLTKEAVEDTFRGLVTESREDRLHNPGLEANRVDVIVGGLCVLVETMRQLSIDEIIVSEFDTLDGVAAAKASQW